MRNMVAIVGRPNVGKSTLFNRLVQQRKAIVHQSSGVTRDRHYGKSDWNGKKFSVIDTGGYVQKTSDIFETEIRKQVILAMEEADVIMFVVDVLSGITDMDEVVAKLLRRSKKKIFVIVNKVDTAERIYDAQVFYALGLGEIYCISSVNGTGTGDLLDEVVKSFENIESPFDDLESNLPKFAVVGRPNVGKSSFINALIGEERNIVTPIAGTTRDSLHTHYNKFGHDFIIVDTAGLRKKNKEMNDIEFYSVMRSIRTIENAEVCFLIIDAERGIEAQDVSIFSLIRRNKKSVVVLVNKWDLVEKEKNITEKFSAQIKMRLEPFVDVPIIFISSLTKQRIFKALETGMEVYANRKQRIPTSKLNEVMLQEIENFPPPAVKGKHIKIKYVTQLPTKSPTFAFFCNLPQYISSPYKRFLENRLREHFNFTGVPITIILRKK